MQIPQQAIEQVNLEDDDIIEKIDDMLENLDNEDSESDDGIEIIGESKSPSSPTIPKARKSDAKRIRIFESENTVQDSIADGGSNEDVNVNDMQES